MNSKGIVTYTFDGWFTMDLPENWEYESDDEAAVLNVYSTEDPQGALQISMYKNKTDVEREELVTDLLERFLVQFNVEVDSNTKMVIQRDDYTIATAYGISNGRFLKVWCLTDGTRSLLITYNSRKKTREVNIADDIVYGIRFIEAS
jgi:hypothetical protein